METVTTTPHVKTFISWMTKTTLVARAALSLEQFRVASSSKQKHEITIFAVMVTTWAGNCKSSIPYIFLFSSLVLAYFSNIVEYKQSGTRNRKK